MRRLFEIAAGVGLAWLALRATASPLPQPAALARAEHAATHAATRAATHVAAHASIQTATHAAIQTATHAAIASQPAIPTPPAPPSAPSPSLPSAPPSAPSPSLPSAPPSALSQPAASPSAPTADADLTLPAHADPIASYTLRASLDTTTHVVHGEGTITWRNASRVPQRELWLHLYLNAFSSPKSVFQRAAIQGFRGAPTSAAAGRITVQRFAVRELDGADLWPSAAPTSPGDPDDATDIRVPLPRDVPPNATLTIDVTWDAHLPPLTFRTGHFGAFHMIAQWFPKLARLEPDGRWAHFPFHRLSEFYADFGAYDVTLDTDAAVIVGATGHLVSDTREGPRALRRFVQDDVHDFAFTAWDGFRERTATTDDGVAIRCLYPPGFEAAADLELTTARWGLDYFGRAYGRYPYATLTLVHPPAGAEEAGGMEYPTLITTGGPWFLSSLGARTLEILTIHELGHQWFYGLVATDEHTSPFLDEGVNSYAESDALEARYPNASAWGDAGLSIGMPAVNRAVSMDLTANAPVAQPAPAFLTGTDYGALVYRRTAAILTTLARVHGDDAVRRAVGVYTRRYRFQHPGPDDFLRVMHENLGPDAAATLRDALFERGRVDYAIEDFSSHREPNDPAPEAQRWIGEVLVRRRGTLRFPVDVAMIGEDGAVQRVTWSADTDAAHLPYAGSSRLVAAVIDPDHRVLLDTDLANNAQRRAPERLPARVLGHALFGAELGLSALLP